MLQNWDRMVMILIGLGVTIYTLLGGWRLWRSGQTGPAIGIGLLALAAMILPVILAVLSG